MIPAGWSDLSVNVILLANKERLTYNKFIRVITTMGHTKQEIEQELSILLDEEMIRVDSNLVRITALGRQSIPFLMDEQ